MAVVISLIVIFFIVGLFILVRCTGYQKKSTNSQLWNKKEALSLFLPMSCFLVEKTGFAKWWEKRGDNKETVEALQVGVDFGKAKIKFLSELFAKILLLLLASSILSLILALNKKEPVMFHGTEIKRPVDGEENKVLNLHVEALEETHHLEKEISLNIGKKRLLEDEFYSIIAKSWNKIETGVLGDNASKDHVDKPLNLIKGIPGTEISMEWETGADSPVNSEGEIEYEKAGELGTDVVLTCVFSYDEFRMEKQLQLRVYKRKYTWDETANQKIDSEIENVQYESRQKDGFYLPETIDGMKISYEEKVEDNAAVILCVGFLAAGILALSTRQSLHKQMKKRDLELRMDYPEIMGKFILLLGAGMTMKGAWMKIVSDYLKKREEGSCRKRFAYEEMLVTCRELENGVTEGRAYENFGRRVRLLPYLKFTTLLVQNMRKGSKGLAEMLEYESQEAYEERKEAAKRLGEEAGTKLLFPMIIMMALVFALIMIPAFFQLSFS